MVQEERPPMLNNISSRSWVDSFCRFRTVSLPAKPKETKTDSRKMKTNNGVIEDFKAYHGSVYFCWVSFCQSPVTNANIKHRLSLPGNLKHSRYTTSFFTIFEDLKKGLF